MERPNTRTARAGRCLWRRPYIFVLGRLRRSWTSAFGAAATLQRAPSAQRRHFSGRLRRAAPIRIKAKIKNIHARCILLYVVETGVVKVVMKGKHIQRGKKDVRGKATARAGASAPGIKRPGEAGIRLGAMPIELVLTFIDRADLVLPLPQRPLGCTAGPFSTHSSRAWLDWRQAAKHDPFRIGCPRLPPRRDSEGAAAAALAGGRGR